MTPMKWVTRPLSSATGVTVRSFQNISPFLRWLRKVTLTSRRSSTARRSSARFEVHAGRGHEARVAPDRFFQAVTGDPLESRVDVLDRIVRAAAAGDHDAVAGRMQGALAQAQLLFLLVAQRDVESHAAQIMFAAALDARARQQVGRAMAFLVEQGGFDEDLLAAFEHLADFFLDFRSFEQVEHLEGAGGEHFFGVVTGHRLESFVPQHKGLIVAQHIKRAGQDVDDGAQVHAADLRAFRAVGRGRAHGHAATEAAVEAGLRLEREVGVKGAVGGKGELDLQPQRLAGRLQRRPAQCYLGSAGLAQQGADRLVDGSGRRHAEQRCAASVPGDDGRILVNQKHGVGTRFARWHCFLTGNNSVTIHVRALVQGLHNLTSHTFGWFALFWVTIFFVGAICLDEKKPRRTVVAGDADAAVRRARPLPWAAGRPGCRC